VIDVTRHIFAFVILLDEPLKKCLFDCDQLLKDLNEVKTMLKELLKLV
jgi:uncharacterized protein (DUF3084 family)